MPISAACGNFLVAFLLALPSFPSMAGAALTLSEAIKTADAKYLDAKDIEPSAVGPMIEAGLGDEASVAAPKEISQGETKAALTYLDKTDAEGEPFKVPVVTVFAGGAEVASLEGPETFTDNPPLAVQIAEIDPGNSTPEVVVSFFTGGAHCCADTTVVTAEPGGSWRKVALGEFDGAELLATDPANDGHAVFEIPDNAFLYAFASYAASFTPLKILAVENATVKDLSRDARFKPAHERHLKSLIGEVPDEDVNGFLAGYVAEKSLLGEGKEAWELMLAYYDKASDWGLSSCDKPLDDDGNCPGKSENLTFPDALERLLNDNGYRIEK